MTVADRLDVTEVEALIAAHEAGTLTLTDNEIDLCYQYVVDELTSWRHVARPEQIWPTDDPRAIMYVRGGRGSGKTWSGSNNLADLIRTSEPGEWGVCAPTLGDARDTCIESNVSGLIRALGGRAGPGGVLIETGPHISRWNRSPGELWLKNGGIVYADGADDGALRIQGKNLRGAWCDEIGLWRRWETAWDESIAYAVRLAPARIIATGTPKRTMPARALVKRLIDDPDVINRRLRTVDNAANLHPARLKAFMAKLGTVLGRQELEGDLIDDTTGALWSYANIETDRWDRGPRMLLGELPRIAVAVDPAVTSNEESDETGIVAGGRTNGICPQCGPVDQPHAFILEDASGRYTPAGMASTTIGVHDRWSGDRIIGEVNNGGDYIEAALRAVDASVPYTAVHASRGKRIRAEPVAALYEQHRVHHVGALPDLEDQLTTWIPDIGTSPDRLDALVWLLTDLLLTGEKQPGTVVW